MARIKGIDIPNDKRIEISLTYIYGIGRKLSKQILTAAKVDLNKKAKDLTEEELADAKECMKPGIIDGFFSSEVLIKKSLLKSIEHKKGNT
jgi:small subunit ribosomal protein S13